MSKRINIVNNVYNATNYRNGAKIKSVLKKLTLLLKNDSKIEADGYMEWPENYGKVIGPFDLLFMNIYNEEKGTLENE